MNKQQRELLSVATATMEQLDINYLAAVYFRHVDRKGLTETEKDTLLRMYDLLLEQYWCDHIIQPAKPTFD